MPGIPARAASRRSPPASGDWRRERDSNPRYGFPYTRFPSVRLKPLGHLSVEWVQQFTGGQGPAQQQTAATWALPPDRRSELSRLERRPLGDDSGIPWTGRPPAGLLRNRISTFSGLKDRSGSVFLTGGTWPRSCGRARWEEVRSRWLLRPQPRHRLEHDHDDYEDSVYALWRLPRRFALLALTTAMACTGRQDETPPATTTAATRLPQALPRPTRPSPTPPRRWMPSRERCGSWWKSRSPETSTRLSSGARFASA